MFNCRSGFCIPNNLKCNGINDCGDNSDEDDPCGKKIITLKPTGVLAFIFASVLQITWPCLILKFINKSFVFIKQLYIY